MKNVQKQVYKQPVVSADHSATGSRVPALCYFGNDERRTSFIFTKQTSDLMRDLRDADPVLYSICLNSTSLQNAREDILGYLDVKESHYFDLLSEERYINMSIIARSNAKECIRVLRNVLRTENEKRTKYSALQALRYAIQKKNYPGSTLTHAFLCEIIALLQGINGRGPSSAVDDVGGSDDAGMDNHEKTLNNYSYVMNSAFQKFPKGTDPILSIRREMMKRRILDYFDASESDWMDYRWHVHHLFTDRESIESVVPLEVDERAGLIKAEQEKIPVQITPYYLTLFNPDGRDETDRCIRAQVLPSVSYCRVIAQNRERGADMDYMGEHFTSPIEGITRRYPSIVILKPFDSCPQICVYCQRNWEIQDFDHGTVGVSRMHNALKWIAQHQEVNEVLVTGGDPLSLDNAKIGTILDRLADIEHVERIRIGTRTPVTIPYRIDNGFVSLLRAYHKPGRRDIAIMTHVEHSAELTGDVIDAVSRIRQCGVSVYNQAVFTYYNSRRFEMSFLRKQLKLCGIDPYYTFNTKGKEETSDFRVPISRLLQEQKEEARLLPGTVRTDEAVFNVPRAGKSHLRAWQDHEPIMILADGRRVYRFFPWNSRLSATSDYLYTDVSNYDYLRRLHLDGEDIDNYKSIWYYF